MFYSWLVPHSFGGSLVLPIQQVQDVLAPSMGAFFWGLQHGWGSRLGAFCGKGAVAMNEPRKPQEWVLEDEVNNWRWHFVEGYMLSVVSHWGMIREGRHCRPNSIHIRFC